MIVRRRKAISDREALAAMFGCYARFGTAKFPIPDGPVGDALFLCRDRGWVWMPDRDHCVIVPQGVNALAPYGVRPEPKGFTE